MATIQKFEDILAWQKARLLTKEVYKSLKSLNDFGFKDQIQRASVSVMSNISEGFERGTRQEFLNYLFIAKGSAGEVRAQLYVALDTGYIDIQKFNSLKGLSEECSILIYRLIQSLKVSKFQGLQHKKEVRKGMSETNKMIIGIDPSLKDYYDAERDIIDFEKMRRDRELRV